MFDLIVVTAANEAQAKGYRAQLRGRKNYIVVPDPGGRRVGSLGATVNVLRQLLAQGQEGRESLCQVASPGGCVGREGRGASCHPQRILICHSGGDAKRTPGYAAMGKAFVPMKDGRPMLDHIVEQMAKLPSRAGVTVCCGDVIPYLDCSKVAFAVRGVTGVAYPDGPWQAQRHGVYMTGDGDKGGQESQEGQGREALVGREGRERQGHEGQERQEGCEGQGREGREGQEAMARVSPVAPVPLVVSSFLQKPKVTRGKFLIDTGILFFDWMTAKKMTKLPIAGDIYEEFPKMLLEGFAPFRVSVVPTCDFFHIGSSQELLEKIGKDGRIVDGVSAPIGKLGGENIVTNVPACYGRIDLAKGECLTSLPLGASEWYHLRYRIGDNFKADGLWEKHGLGEKMKRVNHRRLLALRNVGGKAAERPTVDPMRIDSAGDKGKAAERPTVRVTAPVRIDFAGGWSDTPPICQAEGGTVLAAAVTLDGQRPIEVVVKPRKDRFVKVVSLDLGKRKLIRTAKEIADHHDPHDWCCLVKSALAVTGFRFGERGIDITISANLPKGSGMGTSSILGAATIAALIGEVDVAKVGALTLKLEQEMRTGGGWEDQFAGMTPGVKIMRSHPGEDQRIVVEDVAMPAKFAKELKARSLLYFTGQKRMARNVLRRVLGFYADNPHNFGRVLIQSVKEGAECASQAVRRGDMAAFARCVNDYWRDKKLLDAGSTNEQVDDIIDAIRPYVSSVSLAGAGGGGFMYILARTAAAARQVRAFLEKTPPSRYSRFYDFDVDHHGMTIEFLV